MDWIRRNWPDMLIGVALIAVIAGIIVTLLGGGSPFDLVGGQRSTTPQVQRPPVSAPASDEVESPLTALREDEAQAVGDDVIPVVPLLEGEQVQASDVPATQQATTQQPTTQQTTQEPAAQQPAPATQEPVVQAVPPAQTQQPTTTTPAPTTSTPAPAAAEAGSTSWRISVGSFRQRDNADRLAQQYRDEGYPVFIAQQDDLNIVLLGPYADEAAAQNLAQQLRNAGREARLYVYRPTASETVAASTPSTPSSTPPATTTATTTPQAQTPAATPQTQAPTTTQSPGTANRFVQVGAYTTAESAQPQRQRIEALGYSVTTRTTDAGMIRLWVGPFTDSEAQAVSQRLGAQGIDNFVLTAN